jgi:polysaccharide chain length determinant protein (PEP-CTERM system associated)
MKKLIFKEPVDFITLISRRKWWVLLPFVPLAMVAVLVTMMLPGMYVSEALIIVDSRDLPDDVVKDFITLDTQDRLTTIQEKVLSRSTLNTVLKQFPEGFQDLRHLSELERIERLRKRINVEITTTRGGRTTIVPYFRISYQDRNPVLAQKVTDNITQLFIQEESKVKEDQVQGATQFLDVEASKVLVELSAVELQLQKLKEEHRYELPEQLPTNLATLSRLQDQLTANIAERDRYITHRHDLERMLSETSPVLTEESILSSGGVIRSRSPLVEEYEEKEKELSELKGRYTERHPDVIRLQSQLESLKERIPPEDLLDIETPDEPQKILSRQANPVYQQLVSQLNEVNTELKILNERREQIEREITIYNRRVENTPRWEQEIIQVQRQAEGLRERYQDLQSKLSAAQLTQNLENTQKGEKFQIFDPASFPLDPAKPNRLLILAVGLAGAFGIGLLLAIAAEFVDQKFWTSKEIPELLGLQVLGEIPEILSEDEVKRKKALRWIAGFAYAFGMIVAGGITFLILQQPNITMRGTNTLAGFLGW